LCAGIGDDELCRRLADTIQLVELIYLLSPIFAVGAASTTYFVMRGDLGARRAAVAATVAAVVVGLGWFFVVYLAPAAYLIAAVAYVVARRIMPSVKAAVLAAAAVFAVVMAASVAAFVMALQTM
jgi:hypothetical protein